LVLFATGGWLVLEVSGDEVDVLEDDPFDVEVTEVEVPSNVVDVDDEEVDGDDVDVLDEDVEGEDVDVEEEDEEGVAPRMVPSSPFGETEVDGSEDPSSAPDVVDDPSAPAVVSAGSSSTTAALRVGPGRSTTPPATLRTAAKTTPVAAMAATTQTAMKLILRIMATACQPHRHPALRVG